MPGDGLNMGSKTIRLRAPDDRIEADNGEGMALVLEVYWGFVCEVDLLLEVKEIVTAEILADV
jgi:hypothetical protein